MYINSFSRMMGFVCVLLPALFSCKNEKSPAVARNAEARGPRAIQAEGYIVKTTSLSEDLEAPGSILPFESTEIRSEISGRVVRLNIPEGRYVSKGTLLVKLFDEDLQAQLKKLQVQLQIAEKTAERYAALLKISGISQQEVDLSELQVNNLKADIDLLKVDISKTEIRAPYSGRIGLKSISTGAYISPTTPITTISQTDKLKMEFSVPEVYSEEMTRGRDISFSITGSTRKFKAAIIATATNIEQNTRTLKVLTEVRSHDELLVPGAFAKVTLKLGGDNNAIIVPTQAVIPQARNKQLILYRNGVAKFENVTTGIRDSSYVQITQGVQPGDTIVTTALLAIQPESQIKLTKIQ